MPIAAGKISYTIIVESRGPEKDQEYWWFQSPSGIGDGAPVENGLLIDFFVGAETQTLAWYETWLKYCISERTTRIALRAKLDMAS